MEALTFLALLITAFTGLVLHWYNRYVQGRTQSTFKEYMTAYRSRTIASLGTITASVIGLYQADPTLTTQAFLMAYMLGYNIDSIVNRDASQTEPQAQSAQDDPTFEEVNREALAEKKKRYREAPLPSLESVIDEGQED